MLFENITLLCPDFSVKEHQWVGTRGTFIDYIGNDTPKENYGEAYDGQGRLLMPAFYNCHAHTPMTLMRGYGENLNLQDWLNDRIFPFEAKMTGQDAYHGTLLGLAEGIRYGIVSSSDMYNFCEDMAKAVLDSGAKANIGRHVLAFDDGNLADQPSFQEGKHFFEQYNGAGDGRLIATMALHAEYTSTPKVAAQLADYTNAQNARMQVHLCETKVEVEGCKERHGQTPPAYFAGLGLFDAPTTAAHCVWLEEGDFDILAQKGVSVASCPMSNLKLASGICPTATLMEKGVNVTIGTDSVASNNSLQFLAELKLFAMLPKGFLGDPTLVTPRQALYAATEGGAKSQGREDCGRVEAGCRADLIVLDISAPNMNPVHDLVNNIVYSANAGDVCLTMCDGRVLYQDGEYKTIDIERTVVDAATATKQVLARL